MMVRCIYETKANHVNTTPDGDGGKLGCWIFNGDNGEGREYWDVGTQ